MYNFYQSSIRKTINQDITHKPVWNITLFGKEYQHIIREKKRGPIILCWIQILGIENIQQHTLSQRKQELLPINQKHKPLFIQCWSVDTLTTISSQGLRDTTIIESAKKTRDESTKILTSQWRKSSIKENLPPSTYIIDITKSKEDLTKKLWSQHTTKIKKATKNNISVSVTQWHDIDDFFSILQQTGKEKWFNIVSQKNYISLLSWLQKNNTGNLYVAKEWNQVVAWAIYITDYTKKVWIYLYGWTNKDHRNSWASQLLHREIMSILQSQWIETIDLLWWWPTWYPNHHLASVGTFKEWFGWEKIDYVGSYDIVYKPLLYKIRKIVRLLSH
jgi:lipid II:glycine glycyltransferase (peptidoglycan interpeptide bridge formation enzyme)